MKRIWESKKSRTEGSPEVKFPDSVILIEGLDDFSSRQFKIFIKSLLGSN
jgi:hypothetical protein